MPTPASSPSLDRFRGSARVPVHPAERWLVGVICVHLLFVVWALGGTRGWTMLVSLGFAVVEIALALLPRNYRGAFTTAEDFRLITWPKLVRFPLFWAGLLLLGYIAIQGFNWHWIYERERGNWWIEMRPYRDWLPTSVKAPFNVGGPWPVLTVLTTAWLLVCAIWIGFTRRRSLQTFLSVLAGGGFALGLFGLVQRLSGTMKIFWTWQYWDAPFFASFIYKNHAGAYLNLTLAACIALGAWFLTRQTSRHERSSPAALLFFVATVIVVSALFTYSRGAFALTLVYLAVAAIGGLGWFLRQPSATRKTPVVISFAVLFAVFVGFGLTTRPARLAWERLHTLSERGDSGFRSRQLASAATKDMFPDFWPAGAGAGCFQFHFPAYRDRYPEISRTAQKDILWEHAHNDILEFTLELGAFGTGILLFGVGYWLTALVRTGGHRNVVSLSLLLGCGLMLVHAWLDLVFQSPAVLLPWCAFWPVMVRWAELDQSRRSEAPVR